MEELAHLIAHQLDQTVHIELAGERLGDAVDGGDSPPARGFRVRVG